MDSTIQSFRAIRRAAGDTRQIGGLTHTFYRYPARFSPSFVACAIEHFSAKGDLVLDPYMGGGTTIVEAFAKHRYAVGCDLNSLACFVTRAKVTQLEPQEKDEVRRWSHEAIPRLSYRTVTDEIADIVCPVRTKNLSLPRARPAKKLIAMALLTLEDFRSIRSQDFARAVLLNVSQWALNNRKRTPSLAAIRDRITSATEDMIKSLDELGALTQGWNKRPTLIHSTAENLPRQAPFTEGAKARLVVTSPPYPGIHLLYHRWQVDGRKETAAPYWIADCFDGKGRSYYNFADRTQEGVEAYFDEALRNLRAIRQVMYEGATIVQMIAFSRPRLHLARYLRTMAEAGFEEINTAGSRSRIWRVVPSRAWYAAQRGRTNSSREVVLIHRAA